MDLKSLIIKHEGLKLKPYRDTEGKLTIGVGRNLDDCGITEDEALTLLENDLERAKALAWSAFPWMGKLSYARCQVIISMVFNMGLDGLKTFHKMLTAAQWGNYEEAANEMLASKWAGQVGDRAIELARMMREG